MKYRIGAHVVEVKDERVRTGGPLQGKNKRVVPYGASAVSASSYDSKWEERYAKQLDTLKLAGEIVRWWYHPFSMWLPGKVRYAPDFLVQHHGHLQIVEVKGWSKNLRDGMTRLKIAAGIFGCYQWSLAKWNGRGFDITDVYGRNHE